MIAGEVNAAREVIIRLSVRGADGVERELPAAIDTGFNDELTLPTDLIADLGLPFAATTRAALAGGEIIEVDYFRAVVVWDERARETLVLELAGTPLVGMGLLDQHRLTLEAMLGGRVTIESM